MLIHGFKNYNLFKKYLCTNCRDIGCNICNFVKKTNFLKIKNYVFPILSDCNCNSKGIIYLIACNRCNMYYIGESQRTAKKRLYEHVKKIVLFKNDLAKAIGNLDKESELAIHFNCSFHNLNEDFEVYILNKDIDITSKRKSRETDLINIFKLLKIPLLNRKIPDMKYISDLFFS